MEIVTRVVSQGEYSKMLSDPRIEIIRDEFLVKGFALKVFVVYKKVDCEQQASLTVESEQQNTRILEEDMRDGKIYTIKAGNRQWLEVHSSEHFLDLKMLYGNELYQTIAAKNFYFEKEQLPALIELLQHVHKTLKEEDYNNKTK